MQYPPEQYPYLAVPLNRPSFEPLNALIVGMPDVDGLKRWLQLIDLAATIEETTQEGIPLMHDALAWYGHQGALTQLAAHQRRALRAGKWVVLKAGLWTPPPHSAVRSAHLCFYASGLEWRVWDEAADHWVLTCGLYPQEVERWLTRKPVAEVVRAL